MPQRRWALLALYAALTLLACAPGGFNALRPASGRVTLRMLPLFYRGSAVAAVPVEGSAGEGAPSVDEWNPDNVAKWVWWIG